VRDIRVDALALAAGTAVCQFRSLTLGPPTVLLGMLTMILFWRDAVSLRLWFGASAACYVVIVVLTISYFVSEHGDRCPWPQLRRRFIPDSALGMGAAVG
jgi:hypothetical protein